MGLRVRRSIQLAPGLRVNLSRSGASLSVGKPGATVNFGPKGTRTTVGLPGTGISYSQLSRSNRSQGGSSAPTAAQWTLGILIAAGVLLLIFGALR